MRGTENRAVPGRDRLSRWLDWVSGSGLRQGADVTKRYNLYVIPRTWKMRSAALLGLGTCLAFIATYHADSASDVITRLLLFIGWWGSLALYGLESNWVELGKDGLKWSRVAIVTPGGPVSAGSAESYDHIEEIQLQGSEQVRLRWLEGGRRDKERKMTLRMRPEARNDFMHELRRRMEDDKRRGDVSG